MALYSITIHFYFKMLGTLKASNGINIKYRDNNIVNIIAKFSIYTINTQVNNKVNKAKAYDISKFNRFHFV